jgi:hypothetical protein
MLDEYISQNRFQLKILKFTKIKFAPFCTINFWRSLFGQSIFNSNTQSISTYEQEIEVRNRTSISSSYVIIS